MDEQEKQALYQELGINAYALEYRVLAGYSAIKLAEQGHEVWNRWSQAHPDWTVDFSECDLSDCNNFRYFHFPVNSGVDFSSAKFSQGADFRMTVFGKGGVEFFHANFGSGPVSFSCAKFSSGDVIFSRIKSESADFVFDNSTFTDCHVIFDQADFGEGKVVFNGVEFFTKPDNIKSLALTACKVGGRFIFRPRRCGHAVSFSHSHFESVLDLRGAQFKYTPDFKDAVFKQQLTLHDVSIAKEDDRFINVYKGSGKYKTRYAGIIKELAGRYRALKGIAQLAGNKAQFLDYHARELRLRRVIEPYPLLKALNWCYQQFSDYGRSIGRPVYFLLLTTALMACVYKGWVNYSADYPQTVSGAQALSFSASLALPFAVPKVMSYEATEALFGKALNPGVPTSQPPAGAMQAVEKEIVLPAGLPLVMLLQTLFSTLLFFLLGLALRNQFMSK